MSAITAYSCCCNVEPPACLPERDFRVTFQMQFACEFYINRWTEFEECTGITPVCPVPPAPCECPGLKCLETYYRPSYDCYPPPGNPWNLVHHYVRTFRMPAVTIDILYVNNTTVTDTANWVYDNAGVYVATGMNFTGSHVVNNNSGTFSYDLSLLTACVGCTELVPNPTGDYTATLNCSYVQRATYLTSPAYMTIAKPAGFPGWTWEVTGGQFITRNGGGVIQNVVNLAPLTLAAALAAINALPEVIAAAIYGPIAADALPAAMIEDIAAQLLNLVPVQMPILQLPRGLTELYQNGIMGPRWLLGTPLSQVAFYFKHPSNNVLNYGGGQTQAAEDAFCNCISTVFNGYETLYDPVNDVNEANFIGPCDYLNNVPTWTCQCVGDGSTQIICTETAPCPVVANPVEIDFNAFGNQAAVCGTSQNMCSNSSTISPSSCTSLSDPENCGECACEFGLLSACFYEQTRQAWYTEKQYTIQRL